MYTPLQAKEGGKQGGEGGRGGGGRGGGEGGKENGDVSEAGKKEGQLSVKETSCFGNIL